MVSMGDTIYDTGPDGRLTDDSLRQIASCCHCVGCQLEVCTEVGQVTKELLELREQQRGLLAYVDAAKAAAGEDRLSGEPLADYIARLRSSTVGTVTAPVAACDHQFCDADGNRVYLYCQRGCGTKDPHDQERSSTAPSTGHAFTYPSGGLPRKVLYVAHPLEPTAEEIAGFHGDPALAASRALRANIDRGMAWFAWLRSSFPETTFVAPWIADVVSGAMEKIEVRFANDCAVIERCDGIVLCGGRISQETRKLMEHARAFSARCSSNFWPGDHVYDLSVLAPAPPHHDRYPTFARYMSGLQMFCTR